ncbi:MAG: D-alanine--D-alanine ligase [Clostridia bacterium]|nr:D-alanine--D-alanine ligase [Clostridia bacterium]
MKKNIVVLFGGKSSEYEVSLSSSYALLSNIDREKYNLYTIGITKDGVWYLYEGDIENIRNGSWYETGKTSPVFVSPDNGRGVICFIKDGKAEEVKLDAVFPMLHGKFGEDGQIQGMFSVMGVPVVGCGPASSAVCMDKAMTKAIVGTLGDVRQAASVTMRQGDDAEDAANEAEAKLGYPMFVKPACAGSSVGISKVRTREELMCAMDVALAEDSKLLIEEMIKGCEIEVAVLEEGGKYTVSRPAEIDVGSSDFYDYETKYVSDASSYYIPARLPEEKTAEVRCKAERIFRALDCRGFSRVDFFYTPEGEFVFNEINTIPGFTPISMYPKLMINSGISYSELIDRLIMSALRS